MATNDGNDLFREWDLYAHVVEANWMRHREVVAGLRSALAESRGFQPLRVLDLGCGDGWVAQNVLSDCNIIKYVGADLSESALGRHEQRARPGRHPEGVDKQLIHGDMAEVVQSMADQSVDVVLASYSLHHLRCEQKRQVLDQIARIARTGGGFFWTDVFRNENEERDDFLRRLCQEISTRWNSISQKDRESTISHAWQCDFPERESWMLEQTTARGMTMTQRLFRDDFHGSWWFARSE